MRTHAWFATHTSLRNVRCSKYARPYLPPTQIFKPRGPRPYAALHILKVFKYTHRSDVE